MPALQPGPIHRRWVFLTWSSGWGEIASYVLETAADGQWHSLSSAFSPESASFLAAIIKLGCSRLFSIEILVTQSSFAFRAGRV